LQNGIPSITIELLASFDVAEVQKETKIDPEQIEKWKDQLNESLKDQMMDFIAYTKKIRSISSELKKSFIGIIPSSGKSSKRIGTRFILIFHSKLL